MTTGALVLAELRLIEPIRRCARDVAAMEKLLKRRGFEAAVYAWHGVSIRLPPPRRTYFGLHTRGQFERAFRRIDAGEDVLAVLKEVAG